MKGFPKISTVEYWTSGTDFGADGSFFWCSDKKVLRPKRLNWKSGQPKAADGECLFYQFSGSTFSLGKCDAERNFVCEVQKNIFFSFLSDASKKNHR